MKTTDLLCYALFASVWSWLNVANGEDPSVSKDLEGKYESSQEDHKEDQRQLLLVGESCDGFVCGFLLPCCSGFECNNEFLGTCEELPEAPPGCASDGEFCNDIFPQCCPGFRCDDSLILAGACEPIPTIETVCFSGSSLVEIEGKGSVPLEEAQIGDKVHVGKDIFEPIYSFGHRDPDSVASFLKIKTSTSTLEISPYHLVSKLPDESFIPASSLRVGDTLESGRDGEASEVRSIESVRSRGVFAPFTPSGKIVVDGVVASSYVSFQDKPVRGIFGFSFSYQWLVHTVEFPHRLVCHYVAQCPNEQYDSNGFSSWVSPVVRLVQWGTHQNEITKNILLVAALPVLFSFALVESILLNGIVAFLMALFVASMGYFLLSFGATHTSKSKN